MTTVNLRYVVIYKDSGETRNLYFGPFVSFSVAEDFMNELPSPLPGGLKVCKPMEHQTHGEGRTAKETILAKRPKADLMQTIREIASTPPH